MQYIETLGLLLGRLLLGMYFILPGIQKITAYENTVAYMEAHNVPLIVIALPLTILIQLTSGAAIVVGYKGKFAALVLAILTLIISIYMHNFWAYEPGMEKAHEMQNFVKNMAIMAGLLIVSAIGTGPFSLKEKDKRLFK